MVKILVRPIIVTSGLTGVTTLVLDLRGFEFNGESQEDLKKFCYAMRSKYGGRVYIYPDYTWGVTQEFTTESEALELFYSIRKDVCSFLAQYGEIEFRKPRGNEVIENLILKEE